MGKAALITVHIGSNFGSNLQTIATCEVLKHVGYETIVVNYIPNRVTNTAIFKREIKDGYSMRSFVRGCAQLLVDCINRVIYKRYMKRFCTLTKAVYSNEDFGKWVNKNLKKMDFYITGSDKVWNSHYNEGVDLHYFWNGVVGNKIAYSSSIGAVQIGDKERNVFYKYLSQYKAVSVRELQAKDLLKEIHINSTQVLDPTFMLRRQDWANFASSRIIKKAYILVYIPYNIVDKDLIYNTVNNIAKEKNLIVVTFSWNWQKDNRADYTARYSSPGDFLSLMIHADCVVTNSFHGTAFSVNLNKDFWVYMPSKFPSRIESILKLCKLDDRVLSEVITNEQIVQRINYEQVNDILDEERNKAYSFLRKALS